MRRAIEPILTGKVMRENGKDILEVTRARASAPRVHSWGIPPYPSVTQHIIRFGLYQVDRNRQTKPLLYEVPILTPEDTLKGTNVVVRAG
jgi:hypothetical protein